MNTTSPTTKGEASGATTTLRDPREVIREEPLMHAPILAALADGPATIPAIAERLGCPAHEVVYWVMGMRRYGLLIESREADDDGYFAYGVVGGGPAATLEECEYLDAGREQNGLGHVVTSPARSAEAKEKVDERSEEHE